MTEDLKTVGARVKITDVFRTDRDGHMIGKEGIIKKYEKSKKGIFCHLELDDGDTWIAQEDNIAVV